MENQATYTFLVRHRKKWLTAVTMFLSLVILYFVQPVPSSLVARTILSNLFVLILMAAFVWLGAAALRKWLRDLEFTKRDYRILWITMTALFAAGFVFLFFYFRAERDIRTYDYSLYWRTVLNVRDLMSGSLQGFLSDFVNSLGKEYTFLPATPLVPLSYIFGTGYFGYCFSVYTLYYLPACLFLTVFAMRLLKQGSGQKPSNITVVVSLVTGVISIGFLYPLLYGYLDVAGVLITAILLGVTLHWDTSKLRPKYILSITFLCLLLVLTRRWYAYYILGFFAAYLSMLIAGMAVRRKPEPKKIGYFLLNSGIIAGIAALLIFLVNRDIFLSFLGRDYSVAYSAYKSTGVLWNLWEFVTHSGILWTGICLAGFVVLLRNGKTRMTAIRLFITVVIAVLLFTQVQALYRHHYYLILPTLFIFLCAFCDMGVRYMHREEKPIIVAAAVFVCAVNFLYAFVPAFGYLSNLSIPFTTASHRYPIVRQDYGVIRQIADDLKEKTDDTSEFAYVIGVSDELYDELITRIDLPEAIDAVPSLLVSSTVDLIDGFPSQLFQADYIVLGTPYQDNLSTTQQISFQIYNMFLYDDVLDPYYQLETVYHKGEKDVLLFRRTSPAGREVVDVLKERLREFYPDTPFVYEPNYFLALSDFDDSARLENNYYIQSYRFTRFTNDAPLMKLQDTASFSQLKIQVYADTPGQTAVIRNQNGELQRIPLEKWITADIDLSITGSETIEILSEKDGSAESEDGNFYIVYSDDSLR